LQYSANPIFLVCRTFCVSPRCQSSTALRGGTHVARPRHPPWRGLVDNEQYERAAADKAEQTPRMVTLGLLAVPVDADIPCVLLSGGRTIHRSGRSPAPVSG
jgi:hypothetical protein